MSPKDWHTESAMSGASEASSQAVEALPRLVRDAPAKGTYRRASLTGRRSLAGVSLAVADVLGLAVPAAIGALIWGPGALSDALIQVVPVAASALVAVKAVFGLYPGFGLHPETRLRKAVTAWALATGFAVVALVWLDGAGVGAAALIFLALGLGGLLQAIAARAVRGLLAALGLWGLPVSVLGEADKAAALRAFLVGHGDYGFVPADTGAGIVLWAGSGLPGPEVIARLCSAFEEVVIVSDLPKLRLSGLHPTDHGGALGLRVVPVRGGLQSAGLKRAFDLALTIPVALLALPVVLLAGTAIKIADPGPIFYTQSREGLNGTPVKVLKLRTMYLRAEEMLADLLERDPQAKAEWETHFKLRRDPRILPVAGPLLRALSIDELPQLLNILRGDMSLVGPRPFPEYHLAAMPEEFRRRRASVLPGLTGLWQISDRSTADLAEQEMLDGYYIAGRSFWLDLSIFLRTFAAVLGGRGAY